MKFQWYVVAKPKEMYFDEWAVVAGFVSDKLARVYREYQASLSGKHYDFKVVDAEKFDKEYISLKED